MYIDAVELARTIAMALAERDKENYKTRGGIIVHAKKYGAYDFYGMLDSGQADKWIKTTEKAFTTL